MPLEGSTILQQCLDRHRQGDPGARKELINRSCERLRKMTRKILRGFPGVHRWEETDDVFQNVAIRLHKSLSQLAPGTLAEFFTLAAYHIRCSLIDLARHYFGPHGLGCHAHSPGEGLSLEQKPGGSENPAQLTLWTEFHEKVERLPPEQKMAFDLLWYQGLSQEEAAELMDLSTRTIQRYWRDACLKLHHEVMAIPSDEGE